MKSRLRPSARCATAALLLSLAPPWLSPAAAQAAAGRPASAASDSTKGATVKGAKAQGKTAEPAGKQGKPTKQYTYTITGGC